MHSIDTRKLELTANCYWLGMEWGAVGKRCFPKVIATNKKVTSRAMEIIW